jgi:hypothetical protein
MLPEKLPWTEREPGSDYMFLPADCTQPGMSRSDKCNSMTRVSWSKFYPLLSALNPETGLMKYQDILHNVQTVAFPLTST